MNQTFEVNAIIGRRIDPQSSQLSYLIWWHRFPIEQSTWQPVRHLQAINDLVQEYDRVYHDDYQTNHPNPNLTPPNTLKKTKKIQKKKQKGRKPKNTIQRKDKTSNKLKLPKKYANLSSRLNLRPKKKLKTFSRLRKLAQRLTRNQAKRLKTEQRVAILEKKSKNQHQKN